MESRVAIAPATAIGSHETLGRRLVNASRSSFFERRGPAIAERVADLVDEVAPRLDAWARKFGLIRRERVGPLALSVAAAAPFSTATAIESTARVSLWVFALDDVMDERLLDEQATVAFLSRSRAILRNETIPVEDGSLEQALVEVCGDLASYPLFEEMGSVWANALATTMADMERENRWRDAYARAGILPSLEEYVACGRYSIGGPPHIWAEVLTIGDDSAIGALDHLLRMEEAASICVRLANDLQSERKEAAEGAVNSIVIAAKDLADGGASKGDSFAAARQLVLERIRAGLLSLDEMQVDRHTATGHPEAAIADIARFVSEFYRDFDYHTFSEPVKGPSFDA